MFTVGRLDGSVVKHLTLAQVMISWLMSLSPTSRELERALGESHFSLPPSLSAPPSLVPSLSLSKKPKRILCLDAALYITYFETLATHPSPSKTCLLLFLLQIQAFMEPHSMPVNTTVLQWSGEWMIECLSDREWQRLQPMILVP